MPAHNRDPSDRSCARLPPTRSAMSAPPQVAVSLSGPGRTARGGTEEEVGTCRGVTGPGDSQLR